ncbi:MAG: hypothetical protein KAI79_17640, partial [Bacteroidales bacterium]|nr:hypothetical protein [Bacteroidales bacterium]
LVLVSKIDKEGSLTFNLKGEINQKEVSMSKKLDIKFATENDFIPFIWATRQVGTLLDQIRLSGETKELKDEIVHLAKKYGIITPYTSYLILEDEKIAGPHPPPHPHPIQYQKLLTDDFDMEEAAVEYKEMSKKSGAYSTRSSSEIQQLSNSANIKDISMGQKRMSKNKVKQNTYATQTYKNTQGRAFYKTENTWIDVQLSEVNPKTKERKIKFASKEYFDELSNNPDIGYYYSLGRTCKFYYKASIYHIIE